jgi:heme-degrading monooxygenase HmoA
VPPRRPDRSCLSNRGNFTQGGRIFRNAADPNEILILLAWDDRERVRLFAQSDDLQEAMAREGVIDEPDQ